MPDTGRGTVPGHRLVNDCSGESIPGCGWFSLMAARPPGLGGVPGPISLHLKDKGIERFRPPAHFGQLPGAISAEVAVGEFVPFDHRHSFIVI